MRRARFRRELRQSLRQHADQRLALDGADTNYVSKGVKITFGAGIVAPVDPLFADPAERRLSSEVGRGPLDAEAVTCRTR